MEISKKILIYKKLCNKEALIWTDYLHIKKSLNLWNFPIFPFIHNLLLDLIEKLAYNF